MTIEDLDSLFVSENGFSKFLPMITENSHLRVSTDFKGTTKFTKNHYVNSVDGEIIVTSISYPTAGHSNQKVTMLSFMVTEKNIQTITSAFDIRKPNMISIGDVAVLEVYLIFKPELLKDFQVTFPNNFTKKFTSVVSSLDKYQKLIDVSFNSECKHIKTGRTLKESLVKVDISFCDWKMELPVTVKVYEHELSKLPTIRFHTGNFHFYVDGISIGNLTCGVDDSTLQTMKSLGLKNTPKFRKQSVQRRMMKYYMDEK